MRIRNCNIAFGVLVAVVLVLGVQGIVEALTITQTSSPVVSKPSGSSFELTFTVALSSPKDVNSFNTNSGHTRASSADIAYAAGNSTRARVSTSATIIVDSVFSQGDTHYYTVTTTTTNTSIDGVALTLTTNTRNWATQVESAADTTNRYTRASSSDIAAAGGTRARVAARATITVDAASGTSGAYASDDTHYYTVTTTTINETIDGVALTLTTNTRNWGTENEAYYYNDEAIGITISPERSTTDPPTVTGMLELKNRGFRLPSESKPASETGYTGERGTYSLKERVDIGLPSSITLVFTDASIGEHTIEIWDATPSADFPPDAQRNDNRPRDTKTFKILVTSSTIPKTVPDADDIIPDDRRIPVVADEPQQVNALFTFPGTGDGQNRVDKDYRIHYEVFRGNGILYVGTREQEFKTPPPGQTLLVHQSSNVWIKMNGTSNEVHLSFAGENRSTARARVVYEYRGKDLPGRNTSDNTGNNAGNTVTNTISVSDSSISGAPGTTSDITVGAGSATVRVAGSSGFTSAGGTVSGSGTVRTITLPNTAGDYILTVSASGYTDRQISVTVAAPQALGTLSVSQSGDQVGTQQQILVTASPAPTSSLAFTVTRGGVRVGGGEILTTGSGRAIATVPTTGTYILTVSATGYTTRSVTFTAGAQTTTTDTTTTTTTTTGPAGVADSLEIDGSRQLSRNVNQATPLRVQVVDANDRGVSDVRVTFRVLAPGQGRLSQRGNGRAVQDNTDRNGYASASLTPLGGDVIVEAKAAGVRDSVTFIIDVEGTTEAAPTPRETSTAPTPPTTISPVVHVGAAQRPPMLWVDGGEIYALVGANVQKFASGVENAMNIAVGGNKVYWTEATGERGGTINSANLNGSGVTELASIFATPIGIAVDTAGSKLYWTNAAGRLQSANLDGSRITNEVQNLEGVMDIALAAGNAYWTQGGNVRFVNLRGQKQIRNVSTGMDTAGSLAIAGGKVYWTERTGESGGTVNSANLNGTGARQLASILAAPVGIAVDTARSKLYWTNARGRIQSANLDGSGIRNVVGGLGSPGDMVLSNSIAAPVAGGTSTGSGTTASNKYDVNGDGTVDSKDSDALVVAVAAGITDAKYDVNGDGKVDINDVVAVSANRNGGAVSGAPALIGNIKLSAVQIDRLQEQIELLVATGDRSPAAMKTLIYLQQLIATARPEQTQLLANYPNPFNPETWIPYELATDTNVRITIYNTQGVVIRTLQLGQQSAGYYTDRERAAYWDGRNALGEQVASGVYFYQLETDAKSLMRKMVILK